MPNGEDAVSQDALLDAAIRTPRESDPVIAEILVNNLKSDLTERLRKPLFGFANSRVFLSKIDSNSNEKRIIWEMVKLGELDFLSSLSKEEYTIELDSILQQLIFEVMLGLNLSDEGLGFKGFSESFRFQDIQSRGGLGEEKKKPPAWYSPRRLIR